jgi:Ca-activated chloride channel family protein
MTRLMRCPFCGLLQDEPKGVKTCPRCGGALEFEILPGPGIKPSYLQVQMELDQVAAPAGQNVERHLLLTIRTPDKVPAEEAAPTGQTRPPLSFTAVLDVSGSMQGDKISQAKEAVRLAARFLRSRDVFSLVTFASQVNNPFIGLSCDEHTAARVESALQEISAGGMTALCGGLEKGIKNAHKHGRDTNLLLLLSDGQANVGETDLEKIGARARSAREAGLLVSTLGVGLDYNEALMNEIAIQGGGRFYHVDQAGQIPAFVAGELGEAAFLAAHDVLIELNLPKGATLIPLSAAYPVKQAEEQAMVHVGDIPCATELEIPLRLALLAQKDGTKLSLEGKLEFQSPAGHTFRLPINRVTVRFVKQAEFQLREGVVKPVVERVFTQLRAASVLDMARVRAMRPTEVQKQTSKVMANLYAYADLLGEGRADKELHQMQEEFTLYETSKSASVHAVATASRIQRSSKDFSH